jgi:hypothetical protein
MFKRSRWLYCLHLLLEHFMKLTSFIVLSSRTALASLTTLLTLGLSLPLQAQELAAPSSTPSTALPSKDAAAKVLKVHKANKDTEVNRLAITSCNVLFGTETSADSSTQGGFGSASKPSSEAHVSVSYTLQGMEPAVLQALVETICTDAQTQLAAAGYDMVSAAELAARPEFIKLHAGGKPTPYAYERAGSKYNTYAPAGQQVFDLTYMGTADTFGAVFKTIGSGGSNSDEGALLKALDASGAHVNVMVDFAKAKGDKVKGFLGRIAGQDTAKVEAKMQLSVSGFVTLLPVKYVKCYDARCNLGGVGKETPLFTTEVPLLSGENAVLAVNDIQSTGSKVGEAAVNVLAVGMALSGYGSSTASVTQNGVVVDPTIYTSEVRSMAQQFVGMAAVLSRP